jgi:hypothetical protein
VHHNEHCGGRKHSKELSVSRQRHGMGGDKPVAGIFATNRLSCQSTLSAVELLCQHNDVIGLVAERRIKRRM